MTAFVQCCVLVLLAIVSLQYGNLVIASKDSHCRSFTLTSTWREYAEEEIEDRNGHPVEITSFEFTSLGRVTCERGVNLFLYRNKVHVKNGCKATFDICYKSSDKREPPWSSKCEIFELLSKAHREHTKEFDETMENITIVEQYPGSASCKKGETFGIRDNKVAYASKGCQGNFMACPKSNFEECKIIKLRSSFDHEDTANFNDKLEHISIEEQYKESVQCVRDKNYGIRDNVAYADKGCRGRFQLCFKRTLDCRIIKLLSRQEREDTETFNETIADISINEQSTESAKCVKDKNFGTRDKIAYAEKGCRGSFNVCFKRNYGYDDCDIVKLKSTLKDPHQYIPTDDDGQAVTIVSVRLMKDLGESAGCVENKTFEVKGNMVTAKKACHGKFKICYRKKQPESGSKGCIRIYLGSTSSKTDKQRVTDDNRKIRLFELVRQEEGLKCIRGTNYDMKDGEVYASGGCKGYFKVCLVDTPIPQEKYTCVNVYLQSYSKHEPDWTTVADKDGKDATISDFMLVTEYSKNVCIKGSTYYIKDSKQITASGGCQAKIKICFKSQY